MWPAEPPCLACFFGATIEEARNFISVGQM